MAFMVSRMYSMANLAMFLCDSPDKSNSLHLFSTPDKQQLPSLRVILIFLGDTPSKLRLSKAIPAGKSKQEIFEDTINALDD